MLDARRMADGHVPYAYYNMKHRYNILLGFVLAFLLFKLWCYHSDKKKFPSLHNKLNPTQSEHPLGIKSNNELRG